MERAIVAINTGSASYKYGLYRNNVAEMTMHFERTEEGYACTLDNNDPVTITAEEFERSHEHFFDAAEELGYTLEAIGVRVVAPGTYFAEHRIIDDAFMSELAAVEMYDPAHTKPLYAFLTALRARYEPRHIPIVAVSDSAFHATLSPASTTLPLPSEVGPITRVGYHGISLASLVPHYAPYERVIVCHLGSGASVTALKRGKSIETSMGYSPLEGLVMSSRSGSIDPAAVVRLGMGRTPEETLSLLYKKGGLLALSGVSDDMRVLLAKEKTHPGAALAIEVFVRRIVMYIGAYSALLGGLDALVFSGTIGERSAPIRAKVCAALSHLHCAIDAATNEEGDIPRTIHTAGSLPVIVAHADEVQQIASITKAMMGAQ